MILSIVHPPNGTICRNLGCQYSVSEFMFIQCNMNNQAHPSYYYGSLFLCYHSYMSKDSPPIYFNVSALMCETASGQPKFKVKTMSSNPGSQPKKKHLLCSWSCCMESYERDLAGRTITLLLRNARMITAKQSTTYNIMALLNSNGNLSCSEIVHTHTCRVTGVSQHIIISCYDYHWSISLYRD